MDRERRHHPRVVLDWPVTIRRIQGAIEGITKDISSRGTLICGDIDLHPGEEVRLAIYLPDRLPLVVDAEVIWSEVLGVEEICGVFGIGCRFRDLSKEDQRIIDLAVSENLKVGGVR